MKMLPQNHGLDDGLRQLDWSAAIFVASLVDRYRCRSGRCCGTVVVEKDDVCQTAQRPKYPMPLVRKPSVLDVARRQHFATLWLGCTFVASLHICCFLSRLWLLVAAAHLEGLS